MIRTLSLLLVLLGGALTAMAAKTTTDLTSVFPDRFGRWSAAGPAVKEKFSEPDAAVYTEAGLVDSFGKQYSNGAQSLALSITAFRDPTGAYEAFTYRRFHDMSGATLTETSAVQDDRALLLVGNLLVSVHGLAPDTAAADLKEIAARSRPRADATPFPPIRTYLPVKDRVAGSDLFAGGPVAFRSAMASLDQAEYAVLAQEVYVVSDAEAIAARYHKADGDAVLLLIEYATPQLAEQELHHLQVALAQKLNKNDVTVERKAFRLAIVLGSPTPGFASALRDNVKYETHVTWNEPVFTVTEPPIISTVAKIFAGTGVLLLAAVVLGIAFGGVRIITKALFPGKVFDRPEQIEILQLRLSDKRPGPPPGP